MKTLRLFSIATLLAALFLTGCGSGGGHSATGQQPTRVSGIASKGVFTSGIVNLYALSGGKRGTLLKQASISTFGTYSANLGSYVGPIVAEASGDYLDEATGTQLQVPADAPIRAALPLASGTVVLPVTALTEIAVQKTGGSFTPDAIDAANKVVSDLFKVDIVGVQPVLANADVLNGVSPDQVTYTLALATISQLSLNGSQSLASTLADLASNIEVATSSMNSGAAARLKDALTDFTGNPNNATGIADPASSPLANVGKRTLVVTVSIPGAARIGAVQGHIALPAGVTLNAGSPALAGNALGSILEANASSSSLTLGVLSTAGFAAGNLLSFTCSVPSDQAIPGAADFVLSAVKVLDASRTLLPVSLNLALATVTSSTQGSGTSYSVSLSLPTGLPLIGGVQGLVTLPAGYTLNPGSTTLTGAAVGALLETNPGLNAFTFGIASSSGFASGPFLTFTCTRTAAGTAPEAGGFLLSGMRVIGVSGSTLEVPVTLAVPAPN